MKYYFVDYENVNKDGFCGLNGVECGSVINVIYIDNCKNMPLDIFEEANRLGIVMKAYKAVVGSKNALDFQRSSLLGYMIGTNNFDEEMELIIVSKDTGYDVLVQFWGDRGIHINRFNNLICERRNDSISIQKQPKKEVNGIVLTTKEELLSYISESECVEEILNIINNYKTKQAINNGLSKLCKDSKKSGELYKKIKPLFKEKNKT